jgi:hypothetical protein
VHSAVVVVKLRQDRQTEQKTWREFLNVISPLEANEAAARLGENIWLIDFQRDPGAFALLVSACDQFELSYGILPLENAPQWLPAGFDPKPT